MLKYIKLILWVAISSVVFIFFYCNIKNGTLLYPAQFEFSLAPFFKLQSISIPLGLLIIFSFFSGVLLSAFLGLYQALLYRIETARKNKQIKVLKKKLKKLEDKFPPVSHFPRPIASAPSESERMTSRSEPAPEPKQTPKNEPVVEAAKPSVRQQEPVSADLRPQPEPRRAPVAPSPEPAPVSEAAAKKTAVDEEIAEAEFDDDDENTDSSSLLEAFRRDFR